jgi:hypothetical protein
VTALLSQTPPSPNPWTIQSSEEQRITAAAAANAAAAVTDIAIEVARKSSAGPATATPLATGRCTPAPFAPRFLLFDEPHHTLLWICELA